MTWSSVKDHFKSYQSLYSAVTFDSVIYFKLSSRILIYLQTDVIWKKYQSLSDFMILNKFTDAITFWNIKNVKQLNYWVKEDSNWFLEVLNDFQTQQDSNVKALNLFNKILSDQIWKICYEEMN